MFEWVSSPGIEPLPVLVRLVAALVLGAIVAWIHSRTSGDAEMGASFPATLVLLAVLIAMVTQVIGDNVARAFSLVGALSIVRFRTVVRDTRDTAFVIFAVVVGMAAGAQNIWVGVLGLAVGGSAAFILSAIAAKSEEGPAAAEWRPSHCVTVRAAMAVDVEKSVGEVLAARQLRYRLAAIATVKTGTAMEVEFDVEFGLEVPAEELLRQIGRIDGVQDVKIVRRGSEEKKL
jgi:Domain of unknown function (DUF4956)